MQARRPQARRGSRGEETGGLARGRMSARGTPSFREQVPACGVRCTATAIMPVQRCKEARCTARRSRAGDSRARASAVRRPRPPGRTLPPTFMASTTRLQRRTPHTAGRAGWRWTPCPSDATPTLRTRALARAPTVAAVRATRASLIAWRELSSEHCAAARGTPAHEPLP